MRALVTGATGKVGNAVARQLHERGHEVVALVRDPASAAATVPAGIELARGDVTDVESLRRAAEGIEGAFNCMGLPEQWLPDAATFDRVNAQGARNVIAAAREAGAGRAVHTSTFDVFHAETGGVVSEELVADYPKGTAYERSKQRAEQLVLAEAARGIEVVIVNPSGVYGPGPWAEAGWDSAMRDAIRRRLPAVPPGGLSLVYAEDCARGHLAAFERGRPGEHYILSNGYATVRELIEAAVLAAGHGWVPPTLPPLAAAAMARGGEAISRLVGKPPLLGTGQLHFLRWQARTDNARARDELAVEFTPWREGIARTVRWMSDEGRI